jgi:hypothetical protein
MARPLIEVNLEELDQVLEEARQAPLSEDEYQKLKTVLHALAEWARFPEHGEDQGRPGRG